MRVLFLALALLACATSLCSGYSEKHKAKKIVCYFGSWAVYRPGNGKIAIEDIDPFLCTHLVYTFVGLSTNGGIRVLDPWADLPNDGGKDGFGRFNRLRLKNPSAKILVAIGGWNEGSVKYSEVAASPRLRKSFVENAIAFILKHGFQGLDFDWEYPAQRGGDPEDVKNFVALLKELRTRFDEEGLTLTAALVAAQKSASKSYDIPKVMKYLDFANVMAYDFHGVFDRKTGIHAPLYAASFETGDDRLLNVNASIHYWISQGVPREKLVLGVPFYGRTFTLDNAKDNEIGASANNPGQAGPYTREPGSIGYNEICELLLAGGWQVKWEKEQQVPYMIKGNQWIGYDDIRSMAEKAKFINHLNLGGAMVWSVETDDFRGTCGEKYPLLNLLNKILRES